MNQKPRCVVRVRTGFWSSGRRLHSRRDVLVQRRLSCGFPILEEELGAVGADEVAKSLVNLHAVEDGLYEVILVDIQRDWETGIIDGYRLRLIPYVPD